MSIHVALHHVTDYKYDRRVSLGPQIVRLRPAPHARTRILSYSLKITPAEHFINWQQDPQANYLARLVFPEKTSEFRVVVDLVAEMSVLNPFDFFLEPSHMHYPFTYEGPHLHELAGYMVKMPATPLFRKYLDSIPRAKKTTIDFLVELNQRLQKDIKYLIRLEPGVQTPEETLTNGSGSCRDSAWLMVNLLRHLGVAARFVSGYLIQLVADVKALDGPSGPEADFTDLHAWCEVYLPGAGWIGFDPTSGLMAGEGHIPLACSAEPGSASPIEGGVDECEVEFSHAMQVSRVWETPRVTKPYTRAQWQGIETLGHRVDIDLKTHDVRLTQGGEPTFVSIDRREAAEWNTTALGTHKRGVAGELVRKLKAHYAPQGLLHFGQGKWYPGEQLPRWSLNTFWRRDGQPIWKNPELFASETTDYGVTGECAAAFLAGVAQNLGINGKYTFPAFEDVWYYLWRERKLPTNVDPFDSRLSDPLERARLRKVFNQGLDHIVGHVLPVAWNGDWITGPWFLRDEHCYLVPGDSPLGYRLPLDSQPWVSKGDYPYLHQRDWSEEFPPLKAWQEIRQNLPGVAGFDARGGAEFMKGTDPYARGDQGDDSVLGQREAARRQYEREGRAPGMHESAHWITRTALCAEPRDGRLYLFMPPLQDLNAWLELVAAIEKTAEAHDLPVVLEGYEAPKDPRLNVLRVTPDPGVIEVNIHPEGNWNALVEQTKFLYDAAHAARLSTEKFMLDGRHTGTGGGNHFVLGGAIPADSPFLRRPDLLTSMIGYWHNHPSLSYLFSGLFIGPTSQAPRIDEGRDEAVYELEIAFKEMARLQDEGSLQPWLVDRALRNSLVDLTGNTHRSEFCVDKLFSPDSSTGRLGLLELRAFEMPPHAEMSLAQQLLLRGLVARFWQEPYKPAKLKRWGTELHDRYMLGHFVWDDFGDVLQEMKDFGYAVDPAWFAPHYEFRFPKIGDFSAHNVDVELRLALEPWHVMGEEGAAAGTVRYVDSSVERLQVKVKGLIDDRHVITCNGRKIPLQPTGNVGEFVGAVRYRAWWPTSALHPTIGTHVPLVFDLADTWMSRSMGGCQYHVAHPGGRNYDTFPVNAQEAEARRLARFFRTGHTPGRLAVVDTPRNPNYPFTLDLRR